MPSHNTSAGRGVENVVFRRVTLTGDGAWSPSIIAGYDDAQRVRHVVFGNLQISGKKPTAASSDPLVIGAAVDDVTYR